MTDPRTAAAEAGAEHHTVCDSHGVLLHYYRWNADAPRAVIHLAHGVGEHALRYAPLARLLTAAGYSVIADDHRGHGATGLGAGELSDLGPGRLRAAIDGVELVTRRATADDAAAGLPVILLGHSWGSLMAQKIIARSRLYAGLILTGTSLAIPGYLNIGPLNKPWAGPAASGLEWLSRDPATAEAFAADPLTFDIAVQPAWTSLEALAMLGRPPRRLPRPVPVLIMGGSDDSLGGTRGLTALAAAYERRTRLDDVTLHVYPGARHEIFNETNRDEVHADLITWLDAHYPAREA